VTPNSPAAKAGIRQGDVITAAGGHPIGTVHDLPRLVAETPPGDKLDLTVRREGKEEQLAATVASMPETPQRVAAAQDQGSADEANSLGMQLAAISPKLRSQYRIPKDVEGVVVTKLAPDSPAASLGVEPGDVIVSVERQPATSPQQAAAALKQGAATGNILLLLNRHGNSQFVGLSVTPGVGSGGDRPH
jgi:serine protease Do